MALRLQDLGNKKKKAVTADILGPKPIRPWEAKADTAQSFSGNSAVKKAQVIVNRNNEIVAKLRHSFVSDETVADVESYIKNREKQFSELIKKGIQVKKIKVARGILGHFKSVLLRS